MKTIWKYEIPAQEDIHLKIPKGGEILAVQVQFRTPFIWVLVDPNAEKEDRYFDVIGTGHECNDIIGSGTVRTYIGTFQLHSGSLVFHLFEHDKS